MTTIQQDDSWIEKANWDLIPHHCQDGLKDFFVHGYKTGSFLEAILTGDYEWAAVKADPINKHAIANYARFLMSYAPLDRFGTPEKYNNWISKKHQERAVANG